MTESPTALKRALKLRDLILLNIVAVYTPSTLAQSLPLGWTGLAVWAAAIAGFLLPYATAISDLSAKHPREGGVYAWTRMAFGDFHGFLCGWCYWVNTFLYVPTVFLAVVGVASLLGGERTAWLDQNPLAVTAVAASTLWLAAALHIFGLGQGKWLQNIGAFGRMGAAVAILIAAVWKLAGGDTSLPASPVIGFWPSLALWPFVMNALVGLDLGAAMSDEAEMPQREISRSLKVGGVAVAVCYLLTFAAVAFLGVNDPSPIYGHLQAIKAAVSPTGQLAWLAALAVLVELIGLLGSGAAWLAAPARVPFAIGLDRYLPKAFAAVHPRFGTPFVALLVQALIATILIFINTWGAALKDAYLALLGASIVLVMVTYFYLLAAWRRLSAEKSLRQTLLGSAGLAAILLATAACFIPPPTVENVFKFEANLIGSSGLLLGCGLAIYLFRRKTPRS
ncbi:MAG TPA: APC family permease [Blastocatellia bacterium]|nr:APC family permease [Blastocatellia bacterium]HMZ17778.1 APC family permease [Blastocatellia bacterium]HNG30808.1 APC family permease [Blastocatellia bacterium]